MIASCVSVSQLMLNTINALKLLKSEKLGDSVSQIEIVIFALKKYKCGGSLPF